MFGLMNAPITRAAEGLARRAFTVDEVKRMVEVDNSGKVTGTRASCPAAGLATPKEIAGSVVWYDLRKDGRFGRLLRAADET